jgi:alkane 1-monooxygenase
VKVNKFLSNYSKFYSDLHGRLGYSVLLLFCATPLLAVSTSLNSSLWFWVTPLLFFIVIPFSDLIVGKESVYDIQSSELVKGRPEGGLIRQAIDKWIWVAFLALQLTLISTIYPLIAAGALTFADQLGLIVSILLAMGMTTSVAHEIGHRNSKLARCGSIFMLSAVGYPDFYVFHNDSHHGAAGTPEDPASAKYGQSAWSFIAKNITGNLVSAWQLEAKRTRREVGTAWHIKNRMLWSCGLMVVILSAITFTFGIALALVFLLQSIVSRSLAAAADYLEHYGLARRRLIGGSWQTLGAEHSWSSRYIISPLFYGWADDHAAHHIKPSVYIRSLESQSNSPELPYGSMVMMLIAMIPPLWRRVVHPVLEEHYDQMLAAPHGYPEDLPKRFRSLAVY